jgi:formylglycine-generating enzyme required for sulfatase activity
MSTWNDLHYPFRKALIDAFTLKSLETMLQHRCHRRLETLTGREATLPTAVDDVINAAVRTGWLDLLAEGALADNPSHAQLQAVVPDILAGIAAGDNAFYQRPDNPDPPPSPLDSQLDPYLEWVAQHNQRLALSLLDPSGAKTARLDLARVFINLHATPRQWSPPGETDFVLQERAALAAIHAEPQLILLGDPGSGKSTLLRFLLFCLAEANLEPAGGWLELLSWQRERLPLTREKFPTADRELFMRFGERGEDEEKIEREQHHWQNGRPLPILIELRDFARTPFDPHSPLALWHHVEQQLNERGLTTAVAPLAAQARAGNVIFLLDGVDEVPVNQRRDVWLAVAALAHGAYGRCRWVATCRSLSFDEKEAPAGVPHHTLQPLTEQQISSFITNWYGILAEMGELNDERAESLTTHLQQQIQRPDLQELAQNPMLLTVMAIVQTYYGTLPDERARLYQVCVETLLLRWQLPKEQAAEGKALPDMLTALGVNQQKLERLLWEIAWQAHAGAITRQERADIKESEIMTLAVKQLGSYGKAEQFLAYTEQRAHLLVGRGGLGERVFAFPHRTFQEYLAACYLTPGMRLLKEAPRLAEAGDTWREVLNLAAGALVYNSNDFEKVLFAVERMLPPAMPAAADDPAWYRIWLGGEMTAVVGQQNAAESDVADLLPRLRQLLAGLLAAGALTPLQRAEAGDTLGILGDPRPGVCTLEPDLVEIPAGDFLYGDNKETRTIDKPYAIARYPVTVAQFGLFMAAGGYEEPRYWGGEESAAWHWRVSEHNVKWRGEEPITQPEYWLHSRWHGENRPIVGVSWYEAQVYCAWLTEQSGREYRLPTEEEWERAARHTDGREWAWGDEWQDGIINSKEAGINRTTAVGAFLRGAAECGAQDMSGNVFEWTLSFYDNAKNTYCVRGGSWYSNRDLARVAFRVRNHPDLSSRNFGFRLVSPVF